MAKHVTVTLLPNWVDVTDKDPDGPATFIRQNSKESGVLQMSCAWYEAGPQPRPTDDDLIEFALGIAKRFDNCEVESSACGGCVVGRFGTVVFQSDEFHRGQVWVLSNGRDFVNVTLINL